MPSKFQRNLKLLMLDRQMTQQQLAELIGTSQGDVSRWANGYNSPTLTKLERIRDAFGCSWDELVGDGPDLGAKWRESR